MTTETHWGLSRDPFREGAGPFVPTSGHTEAVARLLHVVESGARVGILEAAPGLGKSRVLDEVLGKARHPQRRIVRGTAASDGEALMAGLARGLGWYGGGSGRTRGRAFQALADVVRLAGQQGYDVILAIDDAHLLGGPSEQQSDHERIEHLEPRGGGRLSVLWVGRRRPDGRPARPWELLVRLPGLTRAESAEYLRLKLAAAGRQQPAFTPGAVTRLHALSRGVPRTLDQLAALALMAGALQDVEIVTPNLVEQVYPECAASLV
jgi:type II secretory pathway predicted ATPase ExeA